MKQLHTYLYGDWGRMFSYLNRLKTISGRLNRILNEIGHGIELRVKQNIYTQKYVGNGIPPIKDNTISKKGRTETMLDTESWVESIQVMDITKEEGKIVIWVGTSDGMETKSGLSFGALAEIFELGSSDGKIPPRPIFTLTWREMRSEIPQRIFSMLDSELRGIAVNAGDWDAGGFDDEGGGDWDG